MAGSLELKRLIALRERENRTLRDDLLRTKSWIDMRMNQQIALHDQMAANHRRMMGKCKVYREDLALASSENDRFERVAQSLASKAEELTGNKTGKRSDNSCEDVQANGDALTEAARAYKKSAEETYGELAVVDERLDEARDRLAKSAETGTCLRRCADNLTALAEAGRARRDAERARQDAETRKIAGALNALMRAAKDDGRSDRLKLDARRRSNGELAAENGRLAAALDELDAARASLAATVAALRQRVSPRPDTTAPR